MEKVIFANGDYKLTAMQIVGETALELLVRKELALKTAEKLGVPRERAETDIAEVLDCAAQHFEKTNMKDRIQCKFNVHKV